MGYRPFLLKSFLDILDLSKLKPLADDKRNVNQKYKLGFDKKENYVGKGENAGYHIESTCIGKKEMQLKYINNLLLTRNKNSVGKG